MQENQSNSGRFAAKISALRQKVLNLDGVEAVEGISECVKDKHPITPIINCKVEDFYLVKEQG